MLQSDSITNIAPAIVAAQAEFDDVSKGGENKFDKYKYAKLEDYIRAARPVLVKHGLAIITSATEVTALEDRFTSKEKAEHVCRVHITLTLIHTTGEWIKVEGWGEGQDRADKAVYKATTGARKYGVAMLLGLITTDDPEADEKTGRDDAPKADAKPVSGKADDFV